MKKIIILLLCFVIYCSSISVIGTEVEPIQTIKDVREIYSSDFNDIFPENYTYSVAIYGPVKWTHTKTTIENVSFLEKILLQSFLRKQILPSIIPVKILPIFKDTNITIKFKRNISRGNESRYFHGIRYRNYIENETGASYNQKCTVHLEGFTGEIISFNMWKMWAKFLSPKQFGIVGHCKNITITYP